jgi:hypothetical protein
MKAKRDTEIKSVANAARQDALVILKKKGHMQGVGVL